MATQAEEKTPLDVVREEQAKGQQNREAQNKRPQSDEVPPGNPGQHPSRQTR